jgi:hypothetical protein
MNNMNMQTTQCISTGERATCWTGHVTVDMYQSGARFVPVAVTAGHRDSATANRLESDGNGCFGEWKPEYGLKIEYKNLEIEVPLK